MISLFFKRAMSTNPIVTPQWLMQNVNKVRLIDATYAPTATRDYKEFKTKCYGNFDLLTKNNTVAAYTGEHIPGAAHFGLDSAYFPSQYIKFDLYPPEHFEKYLRLLGINNDEQVVIYSRGPAAGMMFASRAYWTLKAYGLTNLSLLNGGLDAWKAAGGPTDNSVVTPKLGNVNVKSLDNTILAKFEEIPFNEFAENKVDYLDARTTPQFTGEEPLNKTFPDTKATGSHVTGAISFPMAKVIGPDGFISQQDVDAQIANLGLKSGNQVYVACNTGIQASVIFVALERSGIKAKLYNGSMTELASRAPELVNATGNN
ncbi:thiosulfate sulfurtransferase [Caenorhabditis elegans]|uniref:thiosulfate sulfurtransferase n=1 Tax=Caenorhabditis elegans TaxID=6239 RepID=H9G341_CAEEL|nr:Rhodanese domain-containing protein [Caenorhabditis elegans]CCG28105.1 Rhodanese domain-containing protein [Caenorhabditis elegans]|eukprot:NP_001256631.1 MercaptoPyruvate SulfurTransferase homolog [Caenorhabditis elegans]